MSITMRNAWSLFRLRLHWNGFARRNARGAILTRQDRGPVDATPWSRDEFLRTGSEEIAHVFERLRQQGIQIPQGRALDFGCGVGRLTFALGEHFREAIGVDVSEQMIAMATADNPRPGICRFIHNARTDQVDTRGETLQLNGLLKGLPLFTVAGNDTSDTPGLWTRERIDQQRNTLERR